MNPVRIATLLGAAILTAVGTIGSIDGWGTLAPFLRAAALTAWVVFAVATSTDRILDAIGKLRTDVDTYGDQRHSDGVIDGMQRAAPPQQTIRGLR